MIFLAAVGSLIGDGIPKKGEQYRGTLWPPLSPDFKA